MKYTVCAATGTRAEFGLLYPLLSKLNDREDIELQLVVTGSHLLPEFGNTWLEIERSGLPIYQKIPLAMAGDTKADMADATGRAMNLFAQYFAVHRPDVFLVLGDRFEIFAAAAAAALQGIAVGHIHGGETTQGAVDEFLRHSITKMSYLHFVACEEYRHRVIQLGEAPERVFNVGALGVENILHLSRMSLGELSEDLDFDLESKPYAVVTLHPATQGEDNGVHAIDELLRAMEAFPDMKFLITKANADAGGREINGVWDREAKKHENWRVVASLGLRRYLSALQYAEMMIGNSSSGIIEAPVFHVPTINIGDRQKGRMMAPSILSCGFSEKEIVEAMNNARSENFIRIARQAVSPFGDGNTSDRIIDCILRYLQNRTKDGIKKAFFDVAF